MTKNRLKLWYDKEGDFLELIIGKPVKGYYRPLGNECYERVNKKTGKIVGFAVFNFTKRFPKASKEISLPVEIVLKQAKAAA